MMPLTTWPQGVSPERSGGLESLCLGAVKWEGKERNLSTGCFLSGLGMSSSHSLVLLCTTGQPREKLGPPWVSSCWMWVLECCSDGWDRSHDKAWLLPSEEAEEIDCVRGWGEMTTEMCLYWSQLARRWWGSVDLGWCINWAGIQFKAYHICVWRRGHCQGT